MNIEIEPSWECVEAGWYCHPLLGGITIEGDGKWWWWRKEEQPKGVGPFDTLKKAKEAAERFSDESHKQS